MKLRNSFVANSSSSSFVILIPKNHDVIINHTNCTEEYGFDDLEYEESYPVFDDIKYKNQLLNYMCGRLDTYFDQQDDPSDSDIYYIVHSILNRYCKLLLKKVRFIDIDSIQKDIHNFYNKFHIKCNELVDLELLIDKYIKRDSFLEKIFYDGSNKDIVIKICNDMKNYIIDLVMTYKSDYRLQLLCVPYEDEYINEALCTNAYEGNYDDYTVIEYEY